MSNVASLTPTHLNEGVNQAGHEKLDSTQIS